MEIRRLTLPVLFALALELSSAAEGVCTALIPALPPGEQELSLKGSPLEACAAGFLCQIDNCSGRIGSQPVAIQIFYRSAANRSEVLEVAAGESFLLDDLQADNTLSSALRNLFNVLSGGGPETVRGGRYALKPSATGREIPTGQVAVFADGLSFSIADAPADTGYVFHPQDAPAALNRVAPTDGVFHLDRSLLTPGQRFQGGLEGGPLVPFQVAPEEKLGRVSAELESAAELSEDAAKYRRSLIYFDNGLSWNARRELDGL